MDDTTLMPKSEEELKSLLMKVKEESEKAGLKLKIKKKNQPNKQTNKKKPTTKIMASGSITSWQVDGGNNENSDRLHFPGLQNHCRWLLQP